MASLWDVVGDIFDSLGDVPASISLDTARLIAEPAQGSEAGLRFSEQTGPYIAPGAASVEEGERAAYAAAKLAAEQSPTFADFEQRAGELLFDTFEKLDKPRDLVARAANVTWQMRLGKEWNPVEAWRKSEDVSTGQLLSSVADPANWFGKSYDPYELSEEDRNQIFGHGWRKYASGIYDFGMYWADPVAFTGTGVSKAAKLRNVVRPQDRAVVFASEADLAGTTLTRRQDRQRSLLYEVLEETEGKTRSELYTLDMFQQTHDPGALAYMFSRANEKIVDKTTRMEMKRHILASAFGDPDSVAKMRGISEQLADEVAYLTDEIQDIKNVQMLASMTSEEFVQGLNLINDPAKLDFLKHYRADIDKALEMTRRLASETIGVSGEVRALSAGQDYARVRAAIDLGPRGSAYLVSGKRIPGVFNASDERSVEIFRDVLERTSALAPERRQAWLDRFVAADPKDRFMVAVRAENEIYAATMQKYAPGMTKGQLRALINTTRGRKGSYLRAISQKARTYGQKSDSFIPFVDEDGVIMALDPQMFDEFATRDVPMLSSQLTDTISMIDPRVLEDVLKRVGRHGDLEGVLFRAVDRGQDLWEIAESGLSFANRLWKFSALFRLAYPIRVQVDSQLRMLATLKTQYLLLAGQGMRNWIESQFIPGAQAGLAGNHLRRQLTRRVGLAQMSPRDAKRLDQIAWLGREARSQGKDLDPRLVKEYDKILKRSGVEIYQGVDVTPYRTRDEMIRIHSELSPENSVLQQLTDDTYATTKALRRTGQWDIIAPDDPRWMESYLQAVNHQFRNDPMVFQILNGAPDEAIARWLRTDELGQNHWRRMRAVGYVDEDDLIQRVRMNLDEVAPPGSPMRDAMIRHNVTAEEVTSFWQRPSDRPGIRGEILNPAGEGPRWVEALDEARDKWFKIAAEMPELYMARHPMYVARFRVRMREQVDRLLEQGDGRISLAQANAARNNARKMAQRDVANVMFDIFRQGNLAHTLRFVSPFFSAWEDTMTKWGKIIKQDLGLLQRGYQAWGIPNSAGWVVDENGNQIRRNGDVVDENGKIVGHKGPLDFGQFIVIPLPKTVADKFNIGELWLSKTSFNIVFQGDPWYLPGPGPLAAVPVNMILTGTIPEFVPFNEQLNQASNVRLAESRLAKWALPYGTSEENIELLRPAWVDRLWAWFRKEEHPRFADRFALIYAEEANKIRMGLRPPISEGELLEDVQRRTRNAIILEALASNAAPVTVMQKSPVNYYVQEFQRFRREYVDGADRFRERYPEYYELAFSLSESPTGLSASVPAWEAVEPYRARAARNPEYTWWYAGEANIGGDFSQAVYSSQMAQAIGPGTTKRFRERRDPMEAAKRVQADQGWQEYQAMSTILDLELDRRGLWSVTQRGAEDLLLAKNEFIAQLKEANQTWAQEYLEGAGGNRAERSIRFFLAELQQDSTLAARPGNQRFMEYLEGRQILMDALAARPAKSLSHPNNADLALMWEQFTSDLRASSVGFDQMYRRGGLEFDNLRPIGPTTDG